MAVPVTKLRRRASLEGFPFDRTDVLTPATVLSRFINWEEYSKNDLFLNKEDVQLIRDIQDAPANDQAALLDDLAPKYAMTLMRGISKIANEDALQFLLVLTYQLTEVKREFIGHLLKFPAAASVFQGILQRTNYQQFTREFAGRLLGQIYSETPNSESLKEVRDFIVWILGILFSPSSETPAVLCALLSLKELLRNQKLYSFFVEERGLRALASALGSKHASNIQVAYTIGFCAWLLSFKEVSHDAFVKSDALELIASSLKSNPREKVARIFLATLRNLSGKGIFNELMLNIGVYKVLKNLFDGKSINDEEAKSDLEYLVNALEKDLKNLSTFEMYRKELQAGKLHWTQVHSEKFWKENVNRMEEEDFWAVKALVRLLDSDNIETVAIACYDLGEFARYYPGGKKIITRYKGKEKLLGQMTNPAPEVQRQALIAVQKLLVQNYSQFTA